MDRIIAEIEGEKPGPLLIFLGGVHGNEYPGIIALEKTFGQLIESEHQFCGRAIALRGNLAAIKQGKRFINDDLNRIWSERNAEVKNSTSVEYLERMELESILLDLLKGHKEKAYLFDLHTTSAHTIPFVVTMDMPQHLGFISKLGLPYITGLSGLLDGTLLSWFCKLGHCGLAFEAGQHQSSTSILKHHAFINLSMMYSGFIINLDLDELKNFEEQLSEELQPVHKHFVLVERYVIDPSEDFEMVPGYSNFQKIFKGEILATNRHGRIKANMDANIFMPLYQNQGEDGFFIIKPKD